MPTSHDYRRNWLWAKSISGLRKADRDLISEFYFLFFFFLFLSTFLVSAQVFVLINIPSLSRAVVGLPLFVGAPTLAAFVRFEKQDGAV